MLVSAVSHALVPRSLSPRLQTPAGGAGPEPRDRRLDCAACHGDGHAGVRAGADQSVVLYGGDNEDGGARAAGRRDRRPFGGPRDGRIDADGGVDRGVVWLGLSLWPSLWMLMLWLMAAALWAGAACSARGRTALRPSFWSNALITMLILLGPAIEDSASGKGVFEASAVRVGLFVGVALYAWGTVWMLERWRGARAGGCCRNTTEREETHDA